MFVSLKYNQTWFFWYAHLILLILSGLLKRSLFFEDVKGICVRKEAVETSQS